MNFEWQTEEEGERRAEARQPDAAGDDRASLLRRRWPTALFFLLLLLGASIVFYRQAQKQVEATEATVRERAVASHDLLLKAAAQGDQELLINVLSGRDEAWTDVQKELLARGLLFERPGLGLRLLPDRADPEPEVVLSPALDEVTISFDQHYVLTTTGTASTTVRLAHHAIYRKGLRQWLYSPPIDPDLFWGESGHFEGERLTLTYPGRDAGVAQRLAGDLDAKLVALCRQPEVACADGWQIYLELRPDPALLSRIVAAEPVARQGSALRGRLEFALPTPGLVGVPVDEDAYHVVFRGYARYVLTSAIANLLQYDCCQNLLFFQALVQQQLVTLGIQPPLLSPSESLALMDIFQPVAEIESLWHRSSAAETTRAERRLVRAFVTFLLTQEPSVGAWQRALAKRATFSGWLHRVLDARAENVARLWPEFALARVRDAQARQREPARPLPDQDLFMACRNTVDSDTLMLLRYRPGSDSWIQEEAVAGDRASLLALPGDRSVLFYRHGVPLGEARTFSWHPSGLNPLISRGNAGSGALLPVAYTPASASFDPQGQYLVLLRWNRDERARSGYRLFDLDCAGPTCDDTPFPGVPVWAPDGKQLLAGNGRWIWRMARSDLDERIVEYRGRLPFWLDSTAYGFLSESGVLMLASSEDDQIQPTLLLDQLAAHLPDSDSQPLELTQILATPERPGTMLLVAQMPARARNLIFQVERTPAGPSFLEAAVSDDEIRLLWEHQGEQSPLAYLVDGGRLLAVSSTGRGGAHLRVYDLTSAQEVFGTVLGERMGTVDFSADGAWLALTAADFVELVALPAGGNPPERHFIFPPLANCSSATWIEGTPAGS